MMVLSAPLLRAQAPEPLLIPYALTHIQRGSVDFGDYDGDGDLDLLMTGLAAGLPVANVYRLDDSLFSINVGGVDVPRRFKVYRNALAILSKVSQSTARWGDYDGDGDLDILLMGITLVDRVGADPLPQAITQLYENRTGVFVGNAALDLPGFFEGTIAWGDYDADGDLDFLIAGATRLEAPYDPETRLYRNDGSGRFTDTHAGLPGLVFSAAAWHDYDADGDLDLALMGQSDGAFLTRLYRNDGGTFIDSGAVFPALAFGSLSWADYDSDGDGDLLLTGGALAPALIQGFTRLYRNDGGVFSAVAVDLPGAAFGKGLWGDFDLDGDPDLFLTGAEQLLGVRSAWILRNQGGRFVQEMKLGGLAFGDLAVGDYNADGDLDFVIVGANADGMTFTNFFMNRTLPEVLPADLFTR